MESFRHTDAITLKDVSNFRFALCTFCIKEKQNKNNKYSTMVSRCVTCFWTTKIQPYRCNKLLKGKVYLQTNLKKNPSNFSYIFLLNVNFENLIVGMHVLYVLTTYIKFRSNRILFTIWSINLFFMHNFRLQNLKIKILIDDITTDL